MLARGPHAHDVHAHAHAHVAVVDRVLVLRWRAGSRRARRWPVAGRRQAVVGLCAAAHQAHTRTAGHTHRRAGTHAHARVSAREHTHLASAGVLQHQRLGDAAMGLGQRLGTLGAADAPRSGQQASWPRAAASARASSTASQFSSTATVRGAWWAITDRIVGRSRCRRRTSITGTPQTPRASPVGHGTRARHSCAN